MADVRLTFDQYNEYYNYFGAAIILTTHLSKHT